MARFFGRSAVEHGTWKCRVSLEDSAGPPNESPDSTTASLPYATGGALFSFALAEEFALDLRQRLGFFVQVKESCVTLFLPKSKLEFVVWILAEHDKVEGACFPHGVCAAEFNMDGYPATATSGLFVIREMVREMLERKMGFFSVCFKEGFVGGMSEKEQIYLGLIDPDPIVELDEVLAGLSRDPGVATIPAEVVVDKQMQYLKEMQEESWRSR